MKTLLLAIPVLALVTVLTSCSSPSVTQDHPGSGGTPGLGGATGSGGLTGTGGAPGSGGQPGTGGAPGTGGRTGSGGSSSTGGTTSSGGLSGTGGATTSGGVPGSGGSPGTGGRTGAGGSDVAGGSSGRDAGRDVPSGAGGAATGGTPGTGGTAGAGTGGTAMGGTSGTGTGTSGTSAGCGKTSTITSSQYNNGNPISITVNGSQRRYILSVPTNYVNTTPYKFILGIHALNSNDKSVYSEKYYGLQPLSNNTVIFAAPNGVNGSTPCSGTGVGDSNCGWPAGNNNIQLMDAVVKAVTDNFCVDMNHIYATGWSYGASMSYEVGCERPLGGPTATATWGVRAIAIYAVRQMSGSCKPTIPIGYYLSHGINDSVLGYDGGVSLTQTYATANGCTWATPPKASGSHICTNLTGCKTGYPVEFCSFVGDHTAYPDSGNASSSWGPAEVWKFLGQF